MNKIRTVTAGMTNLLNCVEYRFLRQDHSRYYMADGMSRASQFRINRLLRKHGAAYISHNQIHIDWFVRD